MFVTPKQASEYYGVSKETLRLWSQNHKIKFIKTKKGHRRYQIDVQDCQPTRVSIIYARVSSSKQQNDLDRQVSFLQQKYPNHELITDIGSGINFKRKGLKTLLDKIFSGSVEQIVVAHKDRLTRFGFELFQYICKKFKTELIVIKDDNKSPVEDLSEDLFSIITVFTARYNGMRKYQTNSVLQEDQNISQSETT